MATEFDDSEHWGFFLTGQKLTSETGKYVRMSSLVLAALRAAGVFSTMEDGTTAPATDKLWLDKNTDPPTLKEWDATGASWVPMTYGRLFGQAAVGFLTVTGGTGNAVVISAPTGFQAERLYLVTPTATNTGAATIQVAGVGTFNVKYGDGSDLAAGEFTTGRQTALFFDGTKFVVILAVGASGVPDGSITTPKLANGVLSADATGRGKMADGFLSADTAGRAKMADGYVNTAKIADGAFSADAPGRAKMADGFVTSAKLEASLLSTITTAAPAGAVAAFAMNTAPTGWLKANGAAVSRTTYAALFAAIGTTFGTGDGSTTFNLPDLRGEFVRGWDDARGVDSGRVFGSAQLDQMQRITGTLSRVGSNRVMFSGGDGVFNTPSGADAALNAGTGSNSGLNGNVNFDSANSSGARTGSETRSRNVALLFCIKF